jgi:hypothetical protein
MAVRAELGAEQLQLAELANAVALSLSPGTIASLPTAARPGADGLVAAHSGASDQVERGWRVLVETGPLGLHLPTAMDGGGGGILDRGVAAEAFGRRLAATPHVGSALATEARRLATTSEGLGAILRSATATSTAPVSEI